LGTAKSVSAAAATADSRSNKTITASNVLT
jgi:hypothetical protein